MNRMIWLGVLVVVIGCGAQDGLNTAAVKARKDVAAAFQDTRSNAAELFQDTRSNVVELSQDTGRNIEDLANDTAQNAEELWLDTKGNIVDLKNDTYENVKEAEAATHKYAKEKLGVIRDGDAHNNNKLKAEDEDLQRQIDELEMKLMIDIVNNTTNLEDALSALSEHFTVELLNIELTPGPQGEKGDQGIQGVQGEQGIQGEQGEQGEKGDKGAKGNKGAKGDAGQDGQFGSVITLCPNVSGQFKEVLFSIGGKLYAVLKSGNNVALIEVGNGNWTTTDGRTCNFTVNNGIITAQTGS